MSTIQRYPLGWANLKQDMRIRILPLALAWVAAACELVASRLPLPIGCALEIGSQKDENASTRGMPRTSGTAITDARAMAARLRDLHFRFPTLVASTNYIPAGRTQGHGKLGVRNQHELPVKAILHKPLHSHWRSILLAWPAISTALSNR